MVEERGEKGGRGTNNKQISNQANMATNLHLPCNLKFSQFPLISSVTLSVIVIYQSSINCIKH